MADEQLPLGSVDAAKEFLRCSNDAESENRGEGLKALQFRYGAQWPQYAIASRGLDRPQLTINETNAMIKRICNMQRQQRPRGKASPVDDFADPKVAKIITGLGRHVEVNSDADYAYDTAFDFAATIGWGYIRLRTDYIADDSFNQDIYIDAVRNPFNVYYDWNSVLPDGSDAEGALITELMGKQAFKKKYPDAQFQNFDDRGAGDSDPDWVTTTDVRLAEYYYVDRVRDTLVMLTDGQTLWKSELGKIQRLLTMAGIGIKGDRPSFRRTVNWCKLNAYEVLEKKEIPGKWIPVVPVYWTDVQIDSRRLKAGLVKDAIDPAVMNNFWLTAMTESLALAPKAKWLIPEGGDEGHENDYKNANLAANPVLRFKTTGVDGKEIPPPQRIQPEPPPAGLIQAAMMASQSLSKVLGVVDPATRQGAQHKGEGTLQAERSQFENANFDGYDNLTRSIKQVWRIMLSWVPTTYDTQRVQRIIGDDGKEKMVTLNEPSQGQDPQGQAIDKVLNDVCTGTYDVVMETGPGYDTKRQEGVQGMIELMGTPLGEKVAQAADDLIVRSMDFPGADVIADRLATTNPLSQIDENSEIPPGAQMKMKGMQQMIQQLQGALQAAELEKKARSATAEINAHAKVLTAKIQAEGDKEERDITARSKQHDTEMASISKLHVAEINALAKILTQQSQEGHEARKMLATFLHEANMQENQLEAKAAEPEPVHHRPIGATMPEAQQVDTSTTTVTKPRGRVANDIKVLTQDNFAAHVDEKLGIKPAAEAPKEDAKDAPKKEAKEAAKKEEPDEEIDHPDAEKKGKLNERFSDLTAKRKAAEAKAEAEGKRAKELSERADKAERDAAALRAKYEPPKGDDIGPEPQPEQFADAKEYGKALKDWTSESVRIEDAKKNRAERAQKEFTERKAKWDDAVAAVKQETPDYDKRLNDSTVVLSDQARDAIFDEGDLGPRILLHIADNPEIADKIKDMSVSRMEREIGRIAAAVQKTVKAEAKAEAKADAKAAGTHTAAEISRAPAPISPLNGGGDAALRLDGSKDFHGTYEDYKAARRAGRIK